jgi:serine protease Do
MNIRKLKVLLIYGCVLAVAAREASAAPSPQRAGALGEFSAAIQELTERVSKSVVQIIVTGYGFTSGENEKGSNTLVRQRATGSGVIVSSDGLIMTNSHVVDGARHISVHVNTDPDRSLTLDAVLIGLDRTLDLALIKVAGSGLQPLEFADSDNLKQGQLVFAFGAPLGLDNSMSMGVISSAARQIGPDDPRIYLQTDAPINPGNSGGPLVNAEGRMAGLNTFIFSQSGGSEGLGFAIPSNVVSYAFHQLKTDGHVHRGQIGVALRTITEPLAEGLGLEPYSGALIEDIQPRGSAANSDLKIGDVIVSIGTRQVHSTRDFELGIFRYSIGDFADVKILRGNDLMSVSVEVTEPEDDPQRLADLVDPSRDAIPQLGFLAMEITDDVKKILGDLRSDTGILVAAKTGSSLYDGEDLQLGDVIHGINGEPLASIQDLRTALSKLLPGATIVLQVERENRLQYVVLEAN